LSTTLNFPPQFVDLVSQLLRDVSIKCIQQSKKLWVQGGVWVIILWRLLGIFTLLANQHASLFFPCTPFALCVRGVMLPMAFGRAAVHVFIAFFLHLYLDLCINVMLWSVCWR